MSERISPVTKMIIANLLFASPHENVQIAPIARFVGVSEKTVRREARDLGIIYEGGPHGGVRCNKCGSLLKSDHHCHVCVEGFKKKLKFRRQAFEKQLEENPMSILNRWNEPSPMSERRNERRPT